MAAPAEIESALRSLDGVVDPGEPIDELAHVLPDGPHDRVGAEWLAPRPGNRVAWLVAAHVQAQRWLVATDPSYALSPVSTLSLVVP